MASQPNFLARLGQLRNPNFMSALAQILMSRAGQFGGYGAQEIGKERKAQHEQLREDKRDVLNERVAQSQIETQKRDVELRAQQQQLEAARNRFGQLNTVLTQSLERGVPPSEVARGLKLNLDPDELAGLDESFKAMKAQQVAIDPTTGQRVMSDTMGPFQEPPISLPPEKAADLSERIRGRRQSASQFETSEAAAERRFRDSQLQQLTLAEWNRMDDRQRFEATMTWNKKVHGDTMGMEEKRFNAAEARERIKPYATADGKVSLVDLDKALAGDPDSVTTLELPVDTATRTQKMIDLGKADAAIMRGIDVDDAEAMKEAMADPAFIADIDRAARWKMKGHYPVPAPVSDVWLVPKWVEDRLRGSKPLIADPDNLEGATPTNPLVQSPGNVTQPMVKRKPSDADKARALQTANDNVDEAIKILKAEGFQVD